MTEHLPILRRVGWTLVIVGVVDIGVMIYCIANRISYSSTLNLYAVVAGVLLLRGKLVAARVVAWFCAFMISALLLCGFSVVPWLQPLEYSLMVVRESPFNFFLRIAFVAAMLTWMFWAYRKLLSPVVMEARRAAGLKPGRPVSAFVAGCAFAVLMGVMLQLTMKGESAEKAVRLATEQYGDEYKYFVSSIRWAGSHGSARLRAYNDKESKEVEVEW